MTGAPWWVLLVVGVIGALGVLAGQWLASRRDDARWERERQREQERWAREDRHRFADQRRAAYATFVLEFGKVATNALPDDKPFEYVLEALEATQLAMEEVHIYGSRKAAELAAAAYDALGPHLDPNLPMDERWVALGEARLAVRAFTEQVRADLNVPDA